MAVTPFDNRDGFIWMDGEMRPWAEAKLHYLSHALHYGTQVFEGERAYNGKIFRSADHSKRLIRSGELIYLEVKQSAEEIEDIKKEVLKKNGLENAYVRAAAWRGPEQMGIDVFTDPAHLAVAAWEWGAYYKSDDTGIKLITSQYQKPHPKAAPITSKCAGLYVLSTMAKYEAKQKGCSDAVMHDYEGYVAEATSANIFMVIDGVLVTPLADRFLNGLTRQTILQLAKDHNIEIDERRVKPEELKGAQEVFLTGSAAEITAVGKIDDQDYKVGEITKKMRQAYADYVRA